MHVSTHPTTHVHDGLGLDSRTTLRWQDEEVEGVWSDQAVFLAAHSAVFCQTFVSSHHVHTTVGWEDQEGIEAASGLAQVRVKSDVMFPCHISKWSQPCCQSDVLILVQLEIVSGHE